MAVSWPAGLRSAGVACGIKPSPHLDLGVLAAEVPSAWAGTFTRNGAAAACVGWSRGLLGGKIRAVLVNSGNANACTGAGGAAAVQESAAATARSLGCEPGEIAVASTGPIGVALPVERLIEGIPPAVTELAPEVATFSRAIMTTDTVPKIAELHGDGFSVVGVAKGAAMLAPNMATMLAFIGTDARVDAELLQKTLSIAVSRSFDRISVDACESTNDSVFALSSGLGSEVAPAALEEALQTVCCDLAEQMVRDAEGGSRLVRIQIAGAEDEAAAMALGRGVAASALWRAALHGADPNWGRVLAALGAVDRDLDLASVTVEIGGVCVFAHGAPTDSMSDAAKQMEADEVSVRCSVGATPSSVEILTTDLSPEYVTLNAGGTS